MNISVLCHKAFLQALLEYCPGATFDKQGYAKNLSDNLLPGIDLDDVRADFDAGAGHELEGKMCAPHSSSALAINVFGRWRRDPNTLRICGQTGFESLKFEQQCPTGLGGTPPHLDVLAIAPEAVVAIESKCIEYLQLKHVDFSPSYLTISDARADSPFFKLVFQPRESQYEFRRLDAVFGPVLDQRIGRQFISRHFDPKTSGSQFDSGRPGNNGRVYGFCLSSAAAALNL